MSIGPAGEKRVRFSSLAHYWKNREASPPAGAWRRPGVEERQGAGRPRQAEAEFANAEALKGLVAEMREPLKTGTSTCTPTGRPTWSRASTPWGAWVLQQSDGVLAGRRAVGAEALPRRVPAGRNHLQQVFVACGKGRSR